MTREEAIAVLRREIEPSVYEDEKSIAEAVDMAIGALKDRPKGEWVLVKGSNSKDYHKCSKCFHTQEITGVKNYCAVCGADMRGEKE